MRKRILTLGALLAMLVAFALPGEASLIHNTNITVHGTGLGAVETLVTGHETTPPGSESGCVSFTGTADFFGPCPAGGIEGGDEIANGPGGTVLLSELGLLPTEGGSVGLVFNISETGQDLSVSLQNLALLFYDAAGNLVYTATLDPVSVGVYTQGTGTGLGGSGFVFTLDATQAAQVNALLVFRVGGGFTATNTDDGNETLFAFNAGGQQQVPVPEPAALALFGTGLFAAGVRIRRKWRNPRH